MQSWQFDSYDVGYLAAGLIVVSGSQLVFGFPVILGHDFRVFDTALAILAVYILGQGMSVLAEAAIQVFLANRVLGGPPANLLGMSVPRVRGLLFRAYYTPFTRGIRDRVLQKAEVTGDSQALFFHVRYSREVLSNEKLLARLDLFLSKASFCRTIAFALLLVGVAIAIAAKLQHRRDLAVYGAVEVCSGTLMVYRYLKFYRQYSFEMFSCYVADSAAVPAAQAASRPQ
jgi:hypothetical protein